MSLLGLINMCWCITNHFISTWTIKHHLVLVCNVAVVFSSLLLLHNVFFLSLRGDLNENKYIYQLRLIYSPDKENRWFFFFCTAACRLQMLGIKRSLLYTPDTFLHFWPWRFSSRASPDAHNCFMLKRHLSWRWDAPMNTLCFKTLPYRNQIQHTKQYVFQNIRK